MAVGNNIGHSTPQTYARGIEDKSGRELPPNFPTYPTFMPHMFIFAPKGPTTLLPATTGIARARYGNEALDDSSKFATHQSVAFRVLGSTGMSAMVERVVPIGLTTEMLAKGYKNASMARLRLFLDVSDETDITQYVRNADGTFQTDLSGNYTVLLTGGNPTTKRGRAIRWSYDTVNSTTVGSLTKSTVTGATAGVWHYKTGLGFTRYPIMEFVPNGYGAYYNDVGIRMWATDNDDDGAPTVTDMRKTGSFYYNIAMVKRASSGARANAVTSKNQRASVPVSFNQDIRNSFTKEEMFVGKVFTDEFATDGTPKTYGDIAQTYVYKDNIVEVQKILFEYERTMASTVGDFTDVDENYTMLNILTAKSLTKKPYYTIDVEKTYAGSVNFTDSTNLMMAGGSDGTMNLEVFDYLVKNRMSTYASSNSEIHNSALYPQSCVIDTGFGLDTKDSLNYILANRKDTFVMTTTYVVDGPVLSIASEKALGIVLRTGMQMYPESNYYGTETCRGIICSRHGELIGSSYKHRLPLIIEYAYKCAKMMGAGNGKWKSRFLFDISPNNIINLFKDVSNPWTNPSARKEDWVTAGMNFPLNASRTQLFMPGFRTVYTDETSVLTSAIVMMAAVEMQKIMERVWYEMTGAIRYTPTQFINRVNELIDQKVQGKFGGLVVVKAKSYISGGDALRGYSWSTKAELYANNMRTATTIDLTVYRREDLNEGA